MKLMSDDIRAIAQQLDDVIDCLAGYACEDLAEKLREIADRLEDQELEAMETYD